jgi:uncharacterized protein YndB with AHSA1/START domain
MNTDPIVTERWFDAPVKTVWKALTDKNEMKKWYFDLPDFKLEKGFQFEFMGGPPEGVQYRHLCEITAVVPEKLLAYSWRYDGFAGNSIVTFELIEQGDKTLLKLTHTGLETFPQDNPDFDKKNFIEGWNHIVDISLKDYLEGATT